MVQSSPMPLNTAPDSSTFRVTLFFGPEPVEERPGLVACVFNVKKRSWKAGIQVAVEMDMQHVTAIEESLRLTERLSHIFQQSPSEARAGYEARVPDLFVQAVSRCKLDLRLHEGLEQENQRLAHDALAHELTRAVLDRQEYVLSYILTELDVTHDHSSPSSG